MSKNKFFAVNNDYWGHKWGFKDSSFIIDEDKNVLFTGNRYDICGKKLPLLIPFIEEITQMEFQINPDLKEVKDKHVDQPMINDDFFQDLKNNFHEDRYTTEKNERLLHSHGQTSSDEVYKVLYSKIDKCVDLVFYPESESEVKKLIEMSVKYNICLVPYGGGTSVSSALKIPKEEKRMIVSVDTRRLNNILKFDKDNLLITVESGITGLKLENELKKMGYTVGHEPDSIEFSTVGGWISTNAAGMKKNKYGNIEDIVKNITLITPSGIIKQSEPLTRSSLGIQPQNLIFGSEGNIGMITKATLKVHNIPETNSFESIVFPEWDIGIEFMKELAHSTSSLPASTRLMDNLQLRLGNTLKEEKKGIDKYLDKLKKYLLFNIKGYEPTKIVGGVFKIEGTHEEAQYQRNILYKLAKKHRGVLAGGNQGKTGYNVTAVVAYLRELIFAQNIIGETLETTVPWSKINNVKNALNIAVNQMHADYNLPGKPFFCSRISKIYHNGVCMYSTLAIPFRGQKNPDLIFSKIEHELRSVIMNNGGSISHHHGVGKSRMTYLKDAISDGSINMLKNIKSSEDPMNIFGIRNNLFQDGAH
ncbi:MAG: FAD-binding oxidoreductase [Candidatus Neomarinimicrobiota bacterium]|nr:FAD-binding oxidoreductase [Candidatus Neomarinimicrobiota bacterium]